MTINMKWVYTRDKYYSIADALERNPEFLENNDYLKQCLRTIRIHEAAINAYMANLPDDEDL